MKNKKGLIILSTVVVICAVGFIVSPLVDWSVDSSSTSGDISKSSRFSRKTAEEGLTNMEELMLNDDSYKNGVVVSYVVMQSHAQQFASLVEASNDVAGDIPEFAALLKDMNNARATVNNVCASLKQAGEDINATLGGDKRPDLAQNTMNASLAYSTLQKQNKLADRFIETTDNYLKNAEGNDRLKFVRDQWVDYQRMSAALAGDEKSAKELEDKGYLLTAEQGLAALKGFAGTIQMGMVEFGVICESTNLGPELGESLQGLTLNDIFLIQNDALNVVMQESNSGIQLNQQEFNTLLGEQFFGQLNEQLTGLMNEQGSFQLNEQGTFQLNEQGTFQLNEQLTDLLNEQAGFVLGMINFGEMMAAYGDFTVLQNGEFGTQLNENVIDLDALGEGIKGISLGEVPQLNFY